MRDRNILDEAKSLVHGDRGQDYGPPWTDFARTAKMWEVILGCHVDPHQVALCMIAVKMSRLVNRPEKRDSWVDIAGYAECGDWTVEESRKVPTAQQIDERYTGPRKAVFNVTHGDDGDEWAVYAHGPKP